MRRSTVLPLFRRLSYFVVLVALGVYVAYGLRGPHGIPALLEKRQQVRALQETNANLVKQNELKREKIARLRDSQAEQDLEIRDRLKKMRKTEKGFIIPEDGSAIQPDTPDSAPAPPKPATKSEKPPAAEPTPDRDEP